jgi:hypothetical protein
MIRQKNSNVPGRRGKRNLVARSLLALLPIFLLLARPASPQVFPPYNKVYGIATHNSYWIDRSDLVDYRAGGAQEILMDQLLHEHVHALEIDVHSEGAPAHEWKVYHTSDSEDFSCRYLSDCLEYLRNFHYAVPQHEVITVVIELKNTVAKTGTFFPGIPVHDNFTDDHTIEDFDGIFRRVLGDTLYTPADFLADCDLQMTDPPMTMRQCAQAKGENAWPTIDRLRGKFIIVLEGNWSTAAYDWVQYATRNLRERVAFPIQSVFELHNGSCPENPLDGKLGGGFFQETAPVTTTLEVDKVMYCIGDIDVRFDPSPPIDPHLRQLAFDASVFWQVEDLGSEALDAAKRFLRDDHGVIRGADSFDFGPTCGRDPGGCQEQRVRAGFQLIQTDYPWHFVNDTAWSTFGIPVDPSQRLKDPASLPDDQGNVGAFAVFHEPGSRLYFHTGPQYPGTWVYSVVPTVSEQWLEATVSSTRHGDTWGKVQEIGLSFTADDYLRTCPSPEPPTPEEEAFGVAQCTNFARVAQEDGEGCVKVMSDAETEGIEICRMKNTTDGPSYYQESVDLYVRVFHDGQIVRAEQFRASGYGPCKRFIDPNSDGVFLVCVGSLIAVAVKNEGQSSTASIYSAGRLEPSPSWRPDWHEIETEPFPVPLTKQGYRGFKSELLAGLRSADHLIPVGVNDWRPDFSRLHQITLADLPNQEIAGAFSTRVVPLSFPASQVAAVTRASLSPTPSAAGWNNSTVALTLTAPSPLFPAGAAVQAIDYSLAGAQTLPATLSSGNPATINVSAEGVTVASFFAVDNDGTSERTQSITVRIDETPPVITSVLSPPPNGFGWNRTPVTVSFTCSDALSGLLSCASPVGLSAEGAGQTISGAAQDQALNTASATAVVNIDLTPPTIQFSGNQGTYTVDQTVAIQCTAADNLSGIASSSCVPINKEAYTFTIGLNTISATVIDRADNATTAQTSFQVKVTYDSLCNLTARFSSQAGAPQSLCQKLRGAQDAEARGNLSAKAGKLDAYANEIKAQSGKAFTPDEADVLGRLVTFL